MNFDHKAQWAADNIVLARIGAALYKMDTRVAVTLPSDLADAAVTAWKREDPEPRSELVETEAQRTVRHRAGTLALIGAAFAERSHAGSSDQVGVDLDAWFVGLALEAADEHGLINGPPAEALIHAPRFITVDLDVRTQPGGSLDALARALASTGTIQNDQHDGEGQFVSFALGEQHETIASNVAAIIAVIQRLDPPARSEWDGAASRVFNVGIEAGHEPDQPIVALDAEVVSAAADHEAGITFTHYPCNDRNNRFSHTTIA